MLELNNIYAGYGESNILQNVSITVPAGTLTTVLGSNGVGKTTMLKAIMGLLPINSGEVHWEGQPLDKAVWARSQSGIGYVPQGREIFPFLSVHENLVLGLEAMGYRSEAIKRAADSAYERFPILKPFRRRRGGNLSGGQQQILAIARVIICNPKLLVLDEPSEGIQPSIVRQISDTLETLKTEGTSILLVEQYPDFALAHADFYYLMTHGCMSESGTVTEQNRADIQSRIEI